MSSVNRFRRIAAVFPLIFFLAHVPKPAQASYEVQGLGFLGTWFDSLSMMLGRSPAGAIQPPARRLFSGAKRAVCSACKASQARAQPMESTTRAKWLAVAPQSTARKLFVEFGFWTSLPG